MWKLSVFFVPLVLPVKCWIVTQLWGLGGGVGAFGGRGVAGGPGVSVLLDTSLFAALPPEPRTAEANAPPMQQPIRSATTVTAIQALTDSLASGFEAAPGGCCC